MSRVLKWLRIAATGLVMLVIIAWTAIYLISEKKVNKAWPEPAAAALVLPTDQASIEEGHRLVLIHGCEGCHETHLQGSDFFNEKGVATLIAPNLTQSVKRYSDAQLAQIIRHGTRPGGRGVFAMPAAMFHYLSDADLAHILAYVRSVPAVDGHEPAFAMGPLGRFGVVVGQFKTQPQIISESQPLPPAADSLATAGRYLVQTSCTECHGAQLRGDPFFGSFDVRLMKTFTAAEFSTFMRTGVAPGNPKLPTMSAIAKARFAHFTDAEVTAVYAYLHGLND
jgi:mono/diheme cytochrome c family protein